MNKCHVFIVFIFIGLLCYSGEVFVSGMSAGGINTKWYGLTISGGISIEPARGSEDIIFGRLRDEGDEFSRLLEPFREKFEKVVLEAKGKFGAPIVMEDRKKDSGYIDGVIIEDVMEFSPSSLSADISDERKNEALEYEKQLFQRLNKKESFMSEHFYQYYEKGSHISVEFKSSLPDGVRFYTFSLTVNNRIKRSTLNWIRDQISAVVANALSSVTDDDMDIIE